MIAIVELERLLARTRNEIAEATRAAAPVALDQTSQGRLSRMDAMQQQAMAANRLDRLRQQERKLEAAIARHRDGVYGLCCRCGEAVEEARLRLDPATPFCLACARSTG